MYARYLLCPTNPEADHIHTRSQYIHTDVAVRSKSMQEKRINEPMAPKNNMRGAWHDIWRSKLTGQPTRPPGPIQNSVETKEGTVGSRVLLERGNDQFSAEDGTQTSNPVRICRRTRFPNQHSPNPGASCCFLALV